VFGAFALVAVGYKFVKSRNQRRRSFQDLGIPEENVSILHSDANNQDSREHI
jgi:hypothetical protein